MGSISDTVFKLTCLHMKSIFKLILSMQKFFFFFKQFEGGGTVGIQLEIHKDFPEFCSPTLVYARDAKTLVLASFSLFTYKAYLKNGFSTASIWWCGFLGQICVQR